MGANTRDNNQAACCSADVMPDITLERRDHPCDDPTSNLWGWSWTAITSWLVNDKIMTYLPIAVLNASEFTDPERFNVLRENKRHMALAWERTSLDWNFKPSIRWCRA